MPGLRPYSEKGKQQYKQTNRIILVTILVVWNATSRNILIIFYVNCVDITQRCLLDNINIIWNVYVITQVRFVEGNSSNLIG